MVFLHLIFNHFYFRDLGRSDFYSFYISSPTRRLFMANKKKFSWFISGKFLNRYI